MFKVGDRVRCTNHWNALVRGKVYTVIDSTAPRGYITVFEINNGENSFAEHRFVKVNQFKGNK